MTAFGIQVRPPNTLLSFRLGRGSLGPRDGLTVGTHNAVADDTGSIPARLNMEGACTLGRSSMGESTIDSKGELVLFGKPSASTLDSDRTVSADPILSPWTDDWNKLQMRLLSL